MSIRGLWDRPPKASLHRKCGCETLLLGGISCLVPIREGWSIDGFPEDEAKKLALTQHSSKGCRAYFSNTWENSREKEEWGVLQPATSLLQEISDVSQLFQVPAGLFLLSSYLWGDGYPAVACQLLKTKRAKLPACCELTSNLHLRKPPANIDLPG